jgi:hypothetical protein
MINLKTTPFSGDDMSTKSREGSTASQSADIPNNGSINDIKNCSKKVFSEGQIQIGREVNPQIESRSIQKLEVQEAGDLVLASSFRIDDQYNSFLKTNTLSLSSLELCTQDLIKMEDLYEKIYSQDKELAVVLKEKFDLAQKQVQEMNMSSEVMTSQDLYGIRSFSKAPIEEIYVDLKTNHSYIQPNHSELLAFGGQFFLEGKYSGIGLLRHNNFGGFLCDILYLEKDPDQVSYENPKIWSWSSPKENKEMESRIATQLRLQELAIQELNKKVLGWRYSHCEICGKDQLIQKGMDKDYAQKHHAILFFYKEIQK